MDDSFINLKETETADSIYGQVIHKGSFIMLRYKYKGTPFKLEMPVGKNNEYLKVGDVVEMQLLILKEIK